MFNHISKEIIIYHLFPILSDSSFISFSFLNKYIFHNYYIFYSFKKKYSTTNIELEHLIKLKKLSLNPFPTITWLNVDYKYMNNKIFYENDFNFKNKILKLTIGGFYPPIKKLEKYMIPCSLTYLEFGNNFDGKLFQGNMLPSSLKTLILGDSYNDILNCLPNTLESLTFGDTHNSPLLLGVLPNSLKFLKFGQKYNLPLGTLPDSLQELIFGAHFNSEISSLPSSLKHLTFGYNYSQSIINIVPNSLVSFTFHNKNMLTIFKGYEIISLYNFIYFRNLSSTPSNIPDYLILECKNNKFFSPSFKDLNVHVYRYGPPSIIKMRNLSFKIDNINLNLIDYRTYL